MNIAHGLHLIQCGCRHMVKAVHGFAMQPILAGRCWLNQCARNQRLGSLTTPCLQTTHNCQTFHLRLYTRGLPDSVSIMANTSLLTLDSLTTLPAGLPESSWARQPRRRPAACHPTGTQWLRAQAQHAGHAQDCTRVQARDRACCAGGLSGCCVLYP
jgi:hypothetical protein